jgi:hypothetical protein
MGDDKTGRLYINIDHAYSLMKIDNKTLPSPYVTFEYPNKKKDSTTTQKKKQNC